MVKDDEQRVAQLSHEFRNALACIFQFGNILIGGLAGELSDEQREYVGIMLKNATRIRTLLHSLTEAVPVGSAEPADKNAESGS
jgi:signal transduction histidine kinase